MLVFFSIFLEQIQSGYIFFSPRKAFFFLSSLSKLSGYIFFLTKRRGGTSICLPPLQNGRGARAPVAPPRSYAPVIIIIMGIYIALIHIHCALSAV